MERIKILQQRKADLVKEADELVAKIDDGVELSEDEQKRLVEITDDNGELDKVNAQIKVETKLIEERRTMETVVDLNDDTPAEAAARIEVKPETKAFSSFGEQLQAIAQAGQRGIAIDEWDSRLTNLYEPGGRDIRGAVSGANEAVPSEGGFLVQQDFAAPIFESMFSGGALMSRVRRVPISGNSNGLKTHLIDETSRADGSRWGGIQSYWAGEADAVTASKPTFRELDMRLKKLMGLFYATDELLADSTALEAIASSAFAEEMTFKVEDAIINGDGSGKPLGLLNSGALVTVNAESGQAVSTVRVENILNMWARTPARSRSRLVWLINQDIEPQLLPMTIGTGAAVSLLYAPPGVGGAQNSPFGTLLGRPVVPTEYNASLGTVGDIMLVDLDSYLMIDKSGVQQNASMHVRFLFDEMTFRFIFRVDGQPMWRSAVTPFKGTNTISPYLVLQTRT